MQGKQKDDVFDHACQFFTASDPRFQELAESWLYEGAAALFEGDVGTLQADGQFDTMGNSEVRLMTAYDPK